MIEIKILNFLLLKEFLFRRVIQGLVQLLAQQYLIFYL